MTEQTKDTLARAVAALRRAKSRISELENRLEEPIAIVGLACRFPGADTPEAFWSVLERGEDRIRELPDDRLIGEWPEAVPRWAGTIDQVDGFDAAFFGISPREALGLDPQQRLTLEVTWEALERAGIIPATLMGTRTGVFLGMCAFDYAHRMLAKELENREAYDITGNMASTASGRVAYQLGLKGPAITLDTACSSSLVAMHLACLSLRSRESDLALAGGVNLILSEESTAGLSRTQSLSPDGRCKTFDASANGFVRGEGCGMLVLERLSDARAKNRDILAIVRSSIANQDGKSSGLTAPSVRSQQALLNEALTAASLKPEQVSYIECHGTGTPLGDPIEVEALKAVYGASRRESKLWLGAVKTNIGHLEAAAGIAGVIKVVLAMRNGRLPPNLHLRRLNPRLPLAGTALVPLTASTAWKPETGPRIAGVSSFGLSGTNAHVLLEEPPIVQTMSSPPPRATKAVPLLLTGHTEGALAEQGVRLAEHLAAHPEVELVDIGYSLVTARTQFSRRRVVIATSRESALRQLRDAAGDTHTAETKPNVGFLFTGQGSQHPSMGRELYAADARFRAALDEICAALDPYLGISLRELMFADPESGDSSRLDQTAYTQPAIFALEVALFRLFETWGVEPSCLLGHSIGELAAAHVAGVFSLEDASKLVVARGRLMQELPPGGAMISIQASEAELAAVLEDVSGVDIAAYNGPMSTVISGDDEPVLEIAARFEARGRKTKRLTVSHAFHSHRMDGMLDEFRTVAQSIAYRAPKIPIVSNVTGKLAEARELCSADYWIRHVRAAVRFLDGVHTLEEQGVSVCLELGPHGVLLSMASSCLSDEGRDKVALVPAMRREQPELQTIAQALGTLHCRGVKVDWEAYFESLAARTVSLPTYPFQRQRYWLEVRRSTARDVTSAGLDAPPHHLTASNSRSLGGSQLSKMGRDEQKQALTDMVRDEAAAVLALQSSEMLDPHTPMQELGLDSLMAVELRNRLQRLTDLKLNASFIFDHPTVAGLSAALLDKLEETFETKTSSTGEAGTTNTGSFTLRMIHGAAGGQRAQEHHPWLAGLLDRSLKEDLSEQVWSVLRSFTEIRKQIKAETDEAKPVLVQPFAGSTSPVCQFYCIPSIAAPSTYMQFIKVGPLLTTMGPVWSANNPGYAPGQRLAEDRDTFIRHHLECISNFRSASVPLIVMGYSAGGWLATQVVHELQQQGIAADGLVLGDTIPNSHAREATQVLARFVNLNLDVFLSGGSVHTEEELVYQLTSMLSAFDAWHDWEVPTLEVDTLYVKAEMDLTMDIIGQSSTYTFHTTPEIDWKPHFLNAFTIEPIVADHFQMISEESKQYSNAILAWLEARGLAERKR